MPALIADFQTFRFWRHLGVQLFAALGFQVVLLEVIDFVFGKDDLLSGVKGLVVISGVALIYGILRSWPRPISQVYVSPTTKISVVSGNLLDETSHLVIGMTDTFDTEVPGVIAQNSLQSQFVQTIYGGAADRFEAELGQALGSHTPIGTIQKPGKTSRYPLGTVAVVRDTRRAVFCVAYTEMNEHNQARGTADGVWGSLHSLWDSVSKHGNGEVVSIPVIGGGMSRLSQVLPSQDAIRLTILSFMLASRSSRVCEELRIVVQPKDYDRLDRLELQAFLRSMRPS